MSYNRGKKKFKKNRNKQNGNNLTMWDRILKMFGNPNTELMFPPKKSKTISDEESKKRHRLGMMEFKKVLNSIETKPYIKEKLVKLSKHDYGTYEGIVKLFLFFPYFDYGNKHQDWFEYFYEFISELPGCGGVILNDNTKTGIPMFRSMEKSEFDEMLKNGVQHPSFTGNISEIPRFIKNQCLTSNEEIVVVSCFIRKEDLVIDPTISGLRGSMKFGEQEYWVRKNTKPIRTNVIGRYTKEQYLSIFSPSVKETGLVERYKNVYINTNGFTENVEVTELLDKHVTEESDDIVLKFGTQDLPKLVNKWMKDKKLLSLDYTVVMKMCKVLKEWVEDRNDMFSELKPVTI